LVTTPTTAEPTILSTVLIQSSDAWRLVGDNTNKGTNKMGGHADAYRHLTAKVKYVLSYELSVKDNLPDGMLK
jgi:hypothetical protein